jgi:hypothetical protein
MEIAPYVEAIRSDLEAVATGDDATLAVAERLARALDSSLQLRLLDAIGQAAMELSEQLPTGRVDVRLAGRDVRLVVVGDEPPAAPPAEDEGTARLTLRMPEGLKSRVEAASAREGVSTNAWLVRAVSRGLDQQPRRRIGNRVTGFAQS